MEKGLSCCTSYRRASSRAILGANLVLPKAADLSTMRVSTSRPRDACRALPCCPAAAAAARPAPGCAGAEANRRRRPELGSGIWRISRMDALMLLLAMPVGGRMGGKGLGYEPGWPPTSHLSNHDSLQAALTRPIKDSWLCLRALQPGSHSPQPPHWLDPRNRPSGRPCRGPAGAAQASAHLGPSA